MFKKMLIPLNQRAVLFRDGLPVKALGPGRHRVWGRGLTEQRFLIDSLVFRACAEVREVLPASWYDELELDAHKRAVLFVDGSPRVFLGPGVHRYWALEPSLEVRVFDVREPFPEMTEELEMVIPGSEFVSVVVRHFERAVRTENGRFIETLGPGQYHVWTTHERQVNLLKYDMRKTELSIVGQELMTRDKVSLRMNLFVEYALQDLERTLGVVDLRGSLYASAQLAVREFVAGVTLDQLLEGRDAMTRALEQVVVPQAATLGASVTRIGVKDIVLPGEMKVLLNRVIEAEKEAQANVILRREETAATRSLANTAKVMAEQPLLLRLKELDAMKEIAQSIGEVRVIVGADGLSSLLPSQFLNGEFLKNQA